MGSHFNQMRILDLEQLSLWQRIALAIAVVGFALLAMMLLVRLIDGEALAEVVPVPAPSPFDQHLVELDIRSLDAAYQEQIQHLFHIWLKDDAGQPIRLINGARRARAAYIVARTAIEKRQ